MKNRFLSIFAASLFFFLFSGCASESTYQENQKDANPTPQTDSVAQNTSPTKEDSLRLEAISNGDQSVLFHWSVPNTLDVSEGMTLVRSPNSGPIYPKNYWFFQGSDRRQVTWVNLPKGEEYFRICVMKDKKCLLYSNEIKVAVQ